MSLTRKTEVSKQVWHDHRASRTTQLWSSEWQSDSRGIVFTADFDGRHHLYELRLGEREPTQLTSGAWSVVGESGPAFLGASRADGRIYFIATRESLYERHVYSVPERGGEVRRSTSLPGIHHPVVSPDGSKLALVHSNDTTPPELYLIDSSNEAREQRVTHSPPAEFDTYAWVEPRYVTFESHVDGVTLHGKILEPPNLDRSKKHPVILGPVYPNTARSRWGDRQEWRGLYNLVQAVPRARRRLHRLPSRRPRQRGTRTRVPREAHPRLRRDRYRGICTAGLSG